MRAYKILSQKVELSRAFLISSHIFDSVMQSH